MTDQPHWWDSSSRSSSGVNTFIGDWNQSLLDGGDSSGVYALLGSDQHHTYDQYSDSIDNTNELMATPSCWVGSDVSPTFDHLKPINLISSSNINMSQSKRPSPLPLPPFKVRKEKMGDRITALQQLVSPFGKTDTASVLSEAIEYIKFLHDQVSVLSTPYMKSGAPIQHQQSSKECEELRSRGLCLVPVSSTFPVAHETTVDFWTPTFGGTFR